jgi:imidazolonepropionase-like amidohydrolase
MGVARIGRTAAVWLGLAVLPAAAAGQAAPDTTRTGIFHRATLELALDADGGYRLSAESALLASGRFEARDTLVVVDLAGTDACASADTGRYLVRTAPDSLWLTAVQDACHHRTNALAGGWLRSNGPLLLALTHVTLIDGTGTPAHPDQTIVLRGDTIAAVYGSAANPPPAGAEVLDLAGRYVIPGLIDTHVHLATDPSEGDRRPAVEQRLRSALHGGVTVVRDMAGDGRALADLSRAAVAGDIESPAIYYAAVMAGPEFFTDARVRLASRGVTPGTGPWLRSVTASSNWPRVIAEARGTGATAIKVYAAVPATVLRPLVAEAHRQGLKVWAHATLFPARPSEVVGAGVDVISHASMLVWEGMTVVPPWSSAGPPDSTIRPSNVLVTSLLRLMARRGTMLDATLFVMGDNPARADWAAKVTNEAWKAGVAITAGTDSIGGEQVGSLPNLHEELRLLVEQAGLTPLAAITAATLNGARAIGIEATHGSIAPGKVADLVVLSADPSADIRHTRDIVYVFREGRRFEPVKRAQAQRGEAGGRNASP